MGDDKTDQVQTRRQGAGVVVHDLTHARHDPGHVLAPALFRSLGPRDRKRLKLDVTYIHGDDQIEFRGHEPLGADDLRVLQGLVAMAGPEGLLLRDDGTGSDGAQQLLLDLFTPPGAIVTAEKKPDTLVVRDSFRALARAVGMDEGGASIKQIRKSVERLFGVTIFVERRKKRTGMRLLSAYASDEGSGDLYVALNPRIAGAILGDTQHVRIELAEVRGLESDPARLIHQRLCGWIDPGKTRRATMETLMGYAWPDPPTPAAVRKRRVKVRAAMEELRQVGWSITEDPELTFDIGRPPLPSR